MQAASSPSASTAPSAAAHAARAARRPSLFHQILSELNPLQYLPVVGTIYRAVTGDTIPEAARFAGSLVVSGLTGGPVGIALNVGATALEHLLGIDPEKIGTRLLPDLGVGGQAASGRAEAAVAGQAGGSPDKASPARAWSAGQLSAYGVTRGPGGEFTRGAMSGADVLNGLELARIADRPGMSFSAVA